MKVEAVKLGAQIIDTAKKKSGAIAKEGEGYAVESKNTAGEYLTYLICCNGTTIFLLRSLYTYSDGGGSAWMYVA